MLPPFRGTGTGLTGITVAAFPIDGRIFQRSAGGTTGPVSLSGTYTGTAPTMIQARAKKTSDNSVVVNWTNLSNFTASGGAWSGALPGVTQALKCYAEVRAVDRAQYVSTTSNNFWVGDWIVCYGQSDMNQLFLASSSPAAALDGTGYYNGSAFAAVPAANGVRNLLNNYFTYTGIPCAALNGAINGTPIHNLSPVGPTGTTNYNALAAQITAVGGDAAFSIWYHGSSDANAGTDTQSYISDLAALKSALSTTTGRSSSQMPFLVCGLSTLSGYPDAGMSNIQKALQVAPNIIPNLYYSHSNIDAVISGAEIDAASAGRCGTRFAWSLAYLIGSKSNLASWSIASGESTSGTTTTVNVTHTNGTDFTPTSSITAFEVSDDNGSTWKTTSAAVRSTASKILLTHSSAGNNRLLRYQYGAAPTITGAVADNSTLALPLNTTGSNYVSFLPSGTTPYVAGQDGTADSSGTSHTIAMPGTVVAGDLLLMIVSSYAQDITTPVDGAGVSWTLLASGTSAGGVRGAVFYKIATGVENTSATVVVSSATRVSAVISIIRGHSASKINASSAVTGNGSAPDPASLTASWGSANNLFLTALAARSGGNATLVSGYSSGYTDNQLQKNNSDAQGASAAIASKNAASATDNPGALSLAGSVEFVAFTVAIGPA